MTDAAPLPIDFGHFGLHEAVLRALCDAGYSAPTPIQERALPIVLSGRDILGQAQTGTGKTAAFALPLLSRIDLDRRQPQVLVLAPTRELAIQVAGAFETYGKHLRGLGVAAIYGGADVRPQLRNLHRGVHVVVGTPGRVMDHLRRGSLTLDALRCFVLDEADEMLRMGFIDDVEWIAEQIPAACQRALFAATLPPQVQRIAKAHLNDPAHVAIESRTTAAVTVRQRFVQVSGPRKREALARVLEAESTDGILVFVRTKAASVELADDLEERGIPCAALNGDLAQQQREWTVESLRRGRLKIIIATDVAARGLDVDRISHVVNYDMPHDVETYVHRIGRTGRAGREGQAISIVAPRDRRLLRTIEIATRKQMEEMPVPPTSAVNAARIARFKQRISNELERGEQEMFATLLAEFTEERELDPLQVAAALASLLQGDAPLLLAEPAGRGRDRDRKRDRWTDDDHHRGRRGPPGDQRPRRGGSERRPHPAGERPPSQPEEGMERFRLEVGRAQGVEPRNIVGAIANETGLSGRAIGRIDIGDAFSTVDLPTGMSDETFRHLQTVTLCNLPSGISRIDGAEPTPEPPARQAATRCEAPAEKTPATRAQIKRERPAKPRTKRPHARRRAEGGAALPLGGSNPPRKRKVHRKGAARAGARR